MLHQKYVPPDLRKCERLQKNGEVTLKNYNVDSDRLLHSGGAGTLGAMNSAKMAEQLDVIPPQPFTKESYSGVKYGLL